MRTPKIAVSRGMLWDSVVVSGTNGLSLLSVLVSDAIAAAYFGLSAEMDAYLVASAVPQVLWSVCSSMGARVLVPFLSKAEQEDAQEQLPRVVGALVSYGIAVAALLTLLVMVVGFLLKWLSPGVGVSFWTFMLILLSVGPSLIMEPLRAAHLLRRRFALASVTEVLRYVVIILAVLIAGRTIGVVSLAAGHLIGAVVEVVWLSVTYVALGERIVLKADARLLRKVEVMRWLAPAFAGELTGQINIPIERFVASFLPVGTVSALGYGRKILRALQVLLVSSVGAVLLPSLSKQALERKTAALKQTMISGVRLATIVAGFATILVVDLRMLITSFVFERGAFGAADTMITGRYVAVFVPSVLFMAATYLLVNALFALDESWSVMRLRMAFLMIYIVFALLLSVVLPQMGLAYAYTTSQMVYLMVAGVIVARHLPGFGRELILHFLRLGVATVLTLAGIGLARQLCFLLLGAPMETQAAHMLLSIAAALPVYLAMLIVLRVLTRADCSRWLGRQDLVISQ